MDEMRFLEEIAEHVLKHHQQQTDALTIVFPNRRAGLFFRNYLSTRILQPVWSPEVLSIEDFVKGLSSLKSAEKLDLIYLLYQVFTDLNKSNESFDKFYFWGNVLLQDFDEVDKFMVDTRLLFKNLVHIKKMEGNLDYLQEDQKEHIIKFWKSFGDKLSKQQQGFLDIWDTLYETYERFNQLLLGKNMAYDGMIYRRVVNSLKDGNVDSDDKKVIFAGFNALSKSEEEIISWFVKEGKGEVFWDADDYYLRDHKQEAGKYLRELKFGNPILRNSFRKSYGNSFADSGKSVEVISVASEVGQAQEAAATLAKLNGTIDEDTVVVLPNNSLLFPLLHAIPENVDKLNITMGYPLVSSSIFGLLDALINMHIKAEGKGAYYFRNVLAVLKHPLIAKIQDDEIQKLINDIQQKNILWVSVKLIDIKHDLLGLLFELKGDISEFLIEVIRGLINEDQEAVEREFAFRFIQLFNRFNEFVKSYQLKLSLAAFQKIFRQLAQGERLPFEGEPLLGMQVMGILETRNLDFKNIIVLSMNEGLIPPAHKNTSFIPHSVRKVFNLPVADHQDAMYSYIFYRLVQRAQNIYFIYNATEETGQSGEVSRFVRQLEQETNIEIMHRNVASEVIMEDPQQISIKKNDAIMQQLFRFTSLKKFKKRFTPTAINTYLDCRLRFYFKYVLELYEEEEIAEEVDPMVFGNILHHVMEKLYLPFDKDGNRKVGTGDIDKLKEKVKEEIKIEFSRQFGSLEKEFVFEGQNLLAREIIEKMVLKVLDYDNQQVPFEILGVEADDKKGYIHHTEILSNGSVIQVGIKGIIDRIERKEGHVRIVDYKTGKDEKSFSDIPSLFDRDLLKRNKAVLQTFVYGLLYKNSPGYQKDLPVQASLFNIRDLFRSDFSPLIQVGIRNSKRDVVDIRNYFDEFEAELQNLLEELYNSDADFSQTEDAKKCGYCPYAGMCNR